MGDGFEAACRLVFADPASDPGRPCAVLHLLRRGVARSLPSDLWSAALGLVGGIDHLSRLRYGDVTPAWRFRHALSRDLRLGADEADALAGFREQVCGWADPDGPAAGGIPPHVRAVRAADRHPGGRYLTHLPRLVRESADARAGR